MHFLAVSVNCAVRYAVMESNITLEILSSYKEYIIYCYGLKLEWEETEIRSIFTI